MAPLKTTLFFTNLHVFRIMLSVKYLKVIRLKLNSFHASGLGESENKIGH